MLDSALVDARGEILIPTSLKALLSEGDQGQTIGKICRKDFYVRMGGDSSSNEW